MSLMRLIRSLRFPLNGFGGKERSWVDALCAIKLFGMILRAGTQTHTSILTCHIINFYVNGF